MHVFRSARWLLLALLFAVVPASSFAGVFISVGFAPPVLPVYEQPPCPEAGLMWTPGYWAYGEDGYFWVPGTWVPAPYEGALWTPGYWGWSGGMFVFHEGYWGRHVGYYGGVNYGFGYMGIGFVGGMWRGHEFAYNTEVMRVDERVIHSTYRDRAIVDRYTVARDSRVAFSGGPGGIRHEAGPEERMAERDQHMRVTSFQQQHEAAARTDRGAYFRSNGGRPQNPAVSRPMPMVNHGAPAMRPMPQEQSRPMPPGEVQGRSTPQGHPAYQGQPQSRPVPKEQARPMPPEHAAPQQHAVPQEHAAPKRDESKPKEH